MAVSLRKKKLAGFVEALKEASVLDFKVSYFNNRLKLQKLVYLADAYYRIKLGYGNSYNMYIHGPYSPNLAEDYYKIDIITPAETVNLTDEFTRLVKGKSEEWLELAATALMIRKRYPEIDENHVIKLVRSGKPWAEEEVLKDIITELRI
ncbi:hypothetical protein BMS3Bbin16_01255 [archaeon BMS3Bbin16]|nr:hypothetical protein BMS3Bbin16_01255 [archaeon BMS3Bbin16]